MPSTLCMHTVGKGQSRFQLTAPRQWGVKSIECNCCGSTHDIKREVKDLRTRDIYDGCGIPNGYLWIRPHVCCVFNIMTHPLKWFWFIICKYFYCLIRCWHCLLSVLYTHLSNWFAIALYPPAATVSRPLSRHNRLGNYLPFSSDHDDMFIL